MAAILDKISFFNPQPAIQGVPAGITIDERIHDSITLTRHPVQQGAAITDHKFKNPVEIHINAAWGQPGILDSLTQGVSGPADIYESLLTLQSSNLLLWYIATNGKLYQNIQIKAITKITDPQTYNILALNIALEQVIVVTPVSVPLPAEAQKSPEKTASTVDNGKQAPSTPAPKEQSVLKKLYGPDTGWNIQYGGATKQ